MSAVQDVCGCVGPLWADLVYISKRNRNHRVLPIQEAFQKRLPQHQNDAEEQQQDGSSSSHLPLSVLGDACIAYGFQHIQNIVRGINRKLSTVRGLTLIEMMACPEGCLNGGGQIRGPTAGANAEILSNVTAAHITSEEGAAQLADTTTDAPCTHKPPRVEVSESQGDGISYESVMMDTEWMAKAPGGAPLTDGNRNQGGFVACRMTFHDRKAEMEEADNIVHSLKW
eukprot:GFYU01036875.1.p1 GENE.GFYU01036875.1~~GFYU01036875.1.p1  ORF type:complete len:262 (+),score=24.91 GFYU01036875.1:108-788(+)